MTREKQQRKRDRGRSNIIINERLHVRILIVDCSLLAYRTASGAEVPEVMVDARGKVNCAMARSKALIYAGMPVYFVWNRKSHISNGTAKSVGSHSVSNIRCHGISVKDCAITEILVWRFDAVSGPGTVPGPETASSISFYKLVSQS